MITSGVTTPPTRKATATEAAAIVTLVSGLRER
jgi:hypothetical protein